MIVPKPIGSILKTCPAIQAIFFIALFVFSSLLNLNSQCNNPITTFPVAMGFNGSSLTDWTQNSDDDFDWSFNTGSTGSSGTGPTGPFEGSHYIYTEASGSNYPNKVAIITSPCYLIPANSITTLSFNYHMFSNGNTTMGNLLLQISLDGSTWTTLWSRSNDQGNNWLAASVPVGSYGGSNVQFRFRGETLNSWQSDISVDNFKLESVEILACDDVLGELFDVCESIPFNGSVSDNDSIHTDAFNVEYLMINNGNKGVVNLSSNGDFTYQSNTNAVGLDSFTYERCYNIINDGGLSNLVFNPCGTGKIIDTYIVGIEGEATPNITIPNVNNFNKIFVEVWAESACGSVTIEGVAATETNVYRTDGGVDTEKIYRAELTSVSADGIINISKIGGCVLSSVAAYVERQQNSDIGSSVAVVSNTDLYTAYVGGGNDCVDVAIPLGYSDLPRDIDFTVPLHEKDNGRRVDVTINAGTITASDFVTNNNTSGSGAAVINITLSNIPADVSVANVQVCSPSGNGDSFGIGVVSATNNYCQASIIESCCSQATTTINIQNIGSSISASNPTICIGESTTLTASASNGTGNYTYSWNQGLGNGAVKTVTPNTQTTYQVTITDINSGCFETQSITIQANALPTLNAGNDQSICNGEQVSISANGNGSGPLTYSWNQGLGNGASHTFTPTGNNASNTVNNYSVTLTDGNGCLANDDLDITILSTPSPTVSNNDETCGQGDGEITFNFIDHPNRTNISFSINGGANWTSVNDNIGNYTFSGLSAGVFDLRTKWGNNECEINLPNVTITNVNGPTIVFSGPTEICNGTTTSVSPNTGGVWTSSNTSVATITNSGIIQSVGPGVAVFTFTDSNTQCSTESADTLTVYAPINVSIDFNGTLCLTDNSQLTADATGGNGNYNYSWSGPNNFSSGLETISIIDDGNYYLTVTDGVGCQATTSGFVYQRYEPFIFTLNTEVCEGEDVTLSVNSGSATTYQWGPNAGNSTSNSITVTPSPPSTSYFVTVTNDIGCQTSANADIDVIAKPTTSISGPSTICAGDTTNLLPSTGGVWTSNNPGIASVNNQGVVIGLTNGSASFIFEDNNTGCVSDPTTSISVSNNSPVTISGGNQFCTGISSTLSANVANGIWSSSNPSVASINANSGVLNALSEGTTTISFVPSVAGCYSSSSILVSVSNDVLPNIAGSDKVCQGETTTLSPNSGGTWVSSDNSIATVTNSGIVTGISAGLAYFTFTSSAGCSGITSTPVEIFNKITTSLNGPDSICIGNTTSLFPSSGGIWTSSNPAIASVNASGVVTGHLGGSTVFSFYENINGCKSDNDINISVYDEIIPTFIGPNSICIGDVTQISPSSGGIWESDNPAIASISNEGVITALSPGIARFTFTDNNSGCISSISSMLTVNPKPIVNLNGADNLCVGNSLIISPSSGGTWSSNNPTIASITNQGEVIGLSPGIATFVFTNASTGCQSENTSNLNVIAAPTINFTGPTAVCVGESTSIEPSTGGSWQSSDINIATITNSGIISTIAPGAVNFTYYLSNGLCSSAPSQNLLVNPKPTINITGPSAICINSTTTLSPTTGGIWTSNNPVVASIDNNGLVTGLNEGQTTFNFTNSTTGCVSNASNLITVYDQPIVSIDGTDEICINDNTQLNPSSGGYWISNNPNIAVVSTNGLVTGVGFGQATFSFTENGSGCISNNTLPITIIEKPVTNLSGPNTICVGETTTISPSSGGTWMSMNPSVATINNDGIITGLSQGISKFVFTSNAGCVSEESVPVTVFGKPSIFNPGDDGLCVGSSINLFPSNGGVWTSLDPSIATISNSGLVTGISAGLTRFIFQDNTTSCFSDTSNLIEVYGLPDIAVLGNTEICIGSTTQLSPTTGGLWFSNDPNIAVISNDGEVTGISAGTTTFYFLNFNTSCISNNSVPITIINKPSTNYTNGTNLCVGDTTFILPSTGGTWFSTNNQVAEINNQGRIIAKSQGVVRFRFTQLGGCSSDLSAPLTVNPSPTTGINGSPLICIGSTSQLMPYAGGTWSSSDENIAMVNSAGLVTGQSNGIAYFTFVDDMTGCFSDGLLYIEVEAPPVININGPTQICAGFRTNLSTNLPGLWSSSNESVAIVNNSGEVIGIAPGKTIISFMDAASGCSSGSNSIEITVDKCMNHDFNVTKTNWLVAGNINTNDKAPLNTSYGQSTTLLFKPIGSNPIMNIDVNGLYTFNTDKEGKYQYKISACQAPQTSGCTTTILEITVVGDIYAINNPVNNLEFATTFANSDNDLPGQSIDVNVMANDKCVKTLGCSLNPSALNVLENSPTGIVSTDLVGNLVFNPHAGHIGFDTIKYESCTDDLFDNCNPSFLYITTNGLGANNSVVAPDDYNFALAETPVSGNVMLNDSDPEGDDISVVPQGNESDPVDILGGSYYISANGDYTFIPVAGFEGTTEFIYTLCDNNEEVACMDATVHLMVFGDMSLTTRVYLEGALMNNGNKTSISGKPLMRDNLRVNPVTGNNDIPLSDPYSGMVGFIDLTNQFTHVGPGLLTDNQVIVDSTAVFSIEGDNAIVDWVFIELRAKNDSTQVFATRSALLQRDGDVLDLDGESPVRFNAIGADSFYLAIRHRNHLGAMSQLVSNQEVVDFTNPNTDIYDFGTENPYGLDYTGLAMNANVKNGYMALWAGDFDSNGKLKFTNPNDDQNLLFFDILFYIENLTAQANYDFGYGYLQGDFDLNGKAKFTNPSDDKNMLFSQILLYPLNFNLLDNFNFFIQQIPK